jgi:glycosyltransferase 2 family protein
MNPKNHNQLSYSKISNYKVTLRFVLTWLVTIAIFVILFSRIKLVEVIVLLKQTDIRLLCTGILFSLFAHVFFSSARYQEVVKAIGFRISFFEAVIIRMGCNPIKGILPFKMGELAIVAYMKKMHNLSYPQGFGSIMFGYIFSFIILILFYSFGGIFYFQNQPQRIFFAVVFLLILLLITPLSLRQIPRLLAGCLKKYQKLPEELTSLIEKYDPKTIRILLLHSFGIEGSKLLIILILLKSLSIEISIDALLLLGSTTIIAAYLPITYWGLGIRESAILFLFSGYASPDKLLAGSLLITFVDGLLPVLLGLFFIKPFLNRLLGSEKVCINIVSNGK